MNEVNERREMYRQKYDWLNENSNYGSQNHGKLTYSFVKDYLKPKSLVDVGSACGHYCEWVKKNVCDTVYGLDISIQPKGIDATGIVFLKSTASSLPFWDNSFDVLTCFDVLEHLIEEDVDSALNEFKRVSQRAILCSVSDRMARGKWARKLGMAGKSNNLHATVKNISWWDEKFKELGEVEKLDLSEQEGYKKNQGPFRLILLDK